MRNRFVVLAAALLMQGCLGGVYAWSVLVPSLRADLGFTTAQAQAVFGTTIGVFALTMVAAGRMVGRIGTRRLASLGGLLFGCGYLIASRSQGSFLAILLGVGVVTGAGIGCAYVCPLVACVRWFPRHKGLVTGIAVAGFGGGAVVKAHLLDQLLAAGNTVLNVFQWVGMIYGPLIVLAALALVLPAETGPSSPSSAIPVARLLADPRFRRLALGMTCGTFAGLLVIGNLKPLGDASGLAPAVGTTAVSLLALGNATGRIAWGWISDHVGTRSIPASLLALATAVSLLVPAMELPWLFPLAAACVGLCFGACFVLYAAQVATDYGPAGVASIYPVVFLGYGLAGILGPVTGGWLFDRTHSFLPGIGIAVSLVLVAAHATRQLSSLPPSPNTTLGEGS